jgi:Subtilase family
VWLQNVTKINKRVAQLSSTPTTRIKIAVLDTGCDHEAAFFHSPTRRNRIKGWKDWVHKSANYEDLSGHGTHTVALAMKTAPAADIFIARVARHRAELEGADEVIASVSASSGTLIDPWKGPANII